MKSWASILMLSLGLMAGAAHAADPKPATAASAAKVPSACEAQAAEKKLAGAAKTSFLKKCEADAGAGAQDAQAACEKSAADKKLAGAAKTSHVKKCLADAKAPAPAAAATPAPAPAPSPAPSPAPAKK
jgi:hypothetical protein